MYLHRVPSYTDVPLSGTYMLYILLYSTVPLFVLVLLYSICQQSIQAPPPCGLGHIHFYCIYHMVPYHTWDLTLSRYIHLHHHKYCHAVTSQVFIKMTNSSNNKYIYTIHGKVGFSDMVRLILSTDIYSMYMIAKCPIYQRGYFTL